MKESFRQIPKKALSCILALAVILCSVTVMFSAFATTESETSAYTVSYRSPAIPMFVGKVVELSELEIDFSEADGDTFNGATVIWSAVEGDSAAIMGGTFYAKKAGITKFTASYGGKAQNVYVIVNEAGDGEFELVNLDLTKKGEGGYVAEDWLTANNRAFGGNDLLIKENNLSQSSSGLKGGWTNGIAVYKSEILKDFADYTYSATIKHNVVDSVYGPVGIMLTTRIQTNDEIGEELYAGGRTSGGVLGIQFALYGGPAIYNAANPIDYFSGNTNYYWGKTQLHTVPLDTLQFNTEGNINAFAKNSGKVFSVKVDKDDVVVKVDNRVILDSSAETIYSSVFEPGLRQSNSTQTIGEGCIPVADRNVTSKEVRNAVAATTLGCGTVGFETTYTDGINVQNIKVSLNITDENDLPNLKDPTFYTVKAASPAIPMFVGKQVAVSDLAVEIGGELVSGADITWAVADGSNVKILGDNIYAASTGITKLTARYGDKVQNVWVIVNEANDYDFYLAKEDWHADYTTFDADKWMFVTGNDAPNNLTYYKAALPANAGATWGYYYPYSASVSHFEFYNANGMGMILYKSDILKDFSDYTFSATLLNNTDYSSGVSRGFVLRADINFDAPLYNAEGTNTSVFNTSGLYLGQHRYGAIYAGSFGKDYMKGASYEQIFGMPNWTFHSLTGDNYYKFVNTTETNASSASAAITAGEWAGDPNYVMSMHNAGYANAKVVTVKLEGTDILYKIGENTVLDTKAEKVYALNDYYKQSTANNVEYDWKANTDKIVTNPGTIGFHARQGMSHIYGFSVKLNDVSAETMPKMSNPTFFTVTEASPAIPMYVDKFVHLSDIVIEKDGEIFSAADLKWTVKEGSAMLINGGIYATKVGITTLATTINGVEKRVYVFANNEGDNDFYIVNEILNAANFADEEWIFANAAFSVPAAGYTVLDSSTVQKETTKIGLGYKEHGMLIYKSEMLKDFADYTAEFSYLSNGSGWEHQTTFILRADVDYNVDVDGTIFPNYKTGGKYNALALQFKKFGAPSLRNMTDPFGVVQQQWEKTGYYTVDDFAKIQYSTHGNYNPLYVLGTGGNRTGTVTVKTSGLDVIAKINGNTVLDTTEETIKTVTFTKNATWADDIIVEGEAITSAALKETIATKTNTGSGTVGLQVSRADAYAFSFTGLTVKLNDIEVMPKMSTPAFHKVSADNPVIPMTAATKLNLGSFLVEVGGTLVPSSSFTWSFADADETDIKVADGYVYAYERGAYTATITDGTVTDYIHFVVKNPDETEYVIYEKNFRGDNVDVSEWKTTIAVGAKNPTEYTGLSYSGNQMANNTGLTDSGWGALTYNPPGYAPYNMAEVAAVLSGSAANEVAIYTTLDNDVLADISNYKYTVGLKSYSNHRGSVGVIGRVSNTVDGKYIAGSSGAVGLSSNATGNYKLSTDLYVNGTFTMVNGAQTAVTNAELTRYYFTNNAPRSLAYRSFEIEYSGNTATFTIPNGESQTISIPAGQKGTVGVVGFGYDTSANSVSYGLPILLDAKVTLGDVDTNGLEFEKIDHVPAATPVLEGYTDSNTYSFELASNGYAITKPTLTATPPSKKVVFPTEIGGTVVTHLGDNLFYNNTYMQSSKQMLGEVVIPEGIKTMGWNVFRGNTYIEKVTFPSTLTHVANSTFIENAIVDLSFPEGSMLTKIEDSAFNLSKSLHTVKLPEGLKTIGASAFNNAVVLYDVNIPSTVETIGASAFYATDISEVRLPEATTSLGENAFANCSRLKKVYVLNAELVIDANAIPDTATIYGYTGSTAEEYATANGNEFVPLDDISSNPIPVNTAFNINAMKVDVDGVKVAGSEIVWTAHRDADYEVVNGWLLVYAEKDFTLTGTYNGETVTIDIAVSAKGSPTELEVTTFADKYMTVAPVIGDNNKYTVTIDENEDAALKYGTLTLTADKCNAVKLTQTNGLEGKEYGFEVISPETMILAAEYTTMNERENSLYPLGVQVRPASNVYSAGLRFVTRFPEIKKEAAGIFLDAEYKQVGAIVIPEILWTNGKLPDAEQLANESVSMGEYDAQNVIITKLMTANEAYADAAALLTGIPTNMYDIDIIAIPYLIDKNDKVVFADAEMLTRSYNEVYNAAYPKFSGDIDAVMFGGTDHDIDGDAATTAISYDLDEDISFIIRPKGDYVIKWTLYKDDPEVNAIVDLNEVNRGSSTDVKSGTFTPGKDGSVLIVTTKMKQAGVARLAFNFYDSNDTAIRSTIFYMSAAADYENITQSVEELFTAQQLMAETKGYYETWKTEWDAQVDKVAAAANSDTEFVSWLSDNSKAVGEEKTVGNVLKLKVAVNNGTYTAYNFWIATGEEGLATTGTQNNRPATGVFSVPNSADNSLDMYASFNAWGGTSIGTAAPQAGRLDVRVLNHGKDNGAEFDLSSSTNSENPTDIFAYGVLNRDYVAMQVAKAIFDDKLKDDFSIKTNGGSMGGWQAVTIAALDTDVNYIDTWITWMCQTGANAAGDIESWHPVYCAGLRPFSTVTAARIINERVASGNEDFTIAIEGGLGDYQASAPHGIIAMYNAFTDSKVAKSLSFNQFKEHGNQVYGNNTNFVSAVDNK